MTYSLLHFIRKVIKHMFKKATNLGDLILKEIMDLKFKFIVTCNFYASKTHPGHFHKQRVYEQVPVMMGTFGPVMCL